MAEEIKNNSEKELRKELDNIYTPLAEAEKEIKRRWKDKKLAREVNKFLKKDIPSGLRKRPKAVLARHIATPNHEQMHFLKKVSVTKLTPAFLEYIDDKFSTNNPAKVHLGKITFLHGKEHNGDSIKSHKKILDLDCCDGARLKNITTLSDTSLVDFHHNIFRESVDDIESHIFEESGWISRNGKNPEKFYMNFLALFLRNGILFENYLDCAGEGRFTHDVVLPAIKRIEFLFGMKPLIVRLLPSESEADNYWYWYSWNIFDKLKKDYQLK